MGKETAGRAGAGNVETPAPNDTERKKMKENNNVEGIDQTVSGCFSGLAHTRREWWLWLALWKEKNSEPQEDVTSRDLRRKGK
jgi:hypothetical protein